MSETSERGFARDPVHEENGSWYFWDETWADRLGPYPDEASARKALRSYAEYLEKGPSLPEEPCPTCGSKGCVGYCEPEDCDYYDDPAFDPPQEPPGGWRCTTICGLNWVNCAEDEDTCRECLSKQ